MSHNFFQKFRTIINAKLSQNIYASLFYLLIFEEDNEIARMFPKPFISEAKRKIIYITFRSLLIPRIYNVFSHTIKRYDSVSRQVRDYGVLPLFANRRLGSP